MSHYYFFGVSALITGCGEEDIMDPEEEIAKTQEVPLEKIPLGTPFAITPSLGEIITSSQEFTLTFDKLTTEATVNGISATDTKASGFGGVWVVSPIWSREREISLLSGQKTTAALGLRLLVPIRLLPTKTRLNAGARCINYIGKKFCFFSLSVLL